MLLKKLAKVENLILINILLISNFSIFNSKAEDYIENDSAIIKTSYLESKDELEDYILDTGDTIEIRFKNRILAKSKVRSIKMPNKSDISYLESRKELNKYILDSGDTIKIKFPKTPELSGEFTIDTKGEVFLPKIKNSYIRGLTLTQLRNLLKKRYEEYLISPEIEINISNLKFIESGKFTIDQEGEILLPLISTDPNELTRKTYVRGLTTYELKNLLESRYSNFYINPEVFIRIDKFKGIRISIDGELRIPKLVSFPAYIANYNTIFTDNENKREGEKENKQISMQDSNISVEYTEANLKSSSNFITSLSNAIKEAGGLTSYSDISRIEVIRDIPISKGGGKKRAIIDFWPYLKNGSTDSDIRLFNGDYIYIPRLNESNKKIIPRSIVAGLTPRFINVTVSGRIENPGIVRIPVEGSLSDVMNLAGPRKVLSGKIYLIRYKNDGTLIRKMVNYNSNGSVGSTRNPYLIDGDLITIKNSILGKSSETIGALTAPFTGLFRTRQVIRSLDEN